jgi:hypothetical protein
MTLILQHILNWYQHRIIGIFSCGLHMWVIIFNCLSLHIYSHQCPARQAVESEVVQPWDSIVALRVCYYHSTDCTQTWDQGKTLHNKYNMTLSNLWSDFLKKLGQNTCNHILLWFRNTRPKICSLVIMKKMESHNWAQHQNQLDTIYSNHCSAGSVQGVSMFVLQRP